MSFVMFGVPCPTRAPISPMRPIAHAQYVSGARPIELMSIIETNESWERLMPKLASCVLLTAAGRCIQSIYLRLGLM
jgi:hypothetical protein